MGCYFTVRVVFLQFAEELHVRNCKLQATWMKNGALWVTALINQFTCTFSGIILSWHSVCWIFGCLGALFALCLHAFQHAYGCETNLHSYVTRYKKEWLHDCLLLKIKSTAVYTFLHENEFLPLPHPRTLYFYVKNLKADFRFDANLFIILKEKLRDLALGERRGGKPHILLELNFVLLA